MAITREKASKKEIFGWAMFDFANSAYTTIIITVVFGELFTQLIVAKGDPSKYAIGNSLWSLALCISYGLVLLSAPILGALTDFLGAKKKFLFYSYLVTVISTIAMYFLYPGAIILGILLIVISNSGFSAGENFASSILPDLGPPEDLGKISGYGWGLGYFGGLISTSIVLALGGVAMANMSNLRLVGPITGVFFLVAAIPTFLWVKNHKQPEKLPEGETLLSVGFNRLKVTLKEASKFKDLRTFFFSILFSSAGLYIVISFAFIYGGQVIHWSDGARAKMFILTQISAAGGAVGFGFLQDKIGAKKTYNITLVIWIIAVLMIFGSKHITSMINSSLSANLLVEDVFVWIGFFAGLGVGATQSASRAIVGLFSPDSKTGEFYGVWGMVTKLSALVGVLAIGILQSILGLEVAILVCGCFFVLGLIFNMFVNEERAKKTAEDYIPHN